MICPHCGYSNADQAQQCLSCGYLLRPPTVPRRDYRFALIAVVVLLILGAFIATALSFSRRADSMVSFFGKRGYFDLAGGSIVLAPGEQKVYTLRNPERTSVCRFYGTVASERPGASVLLVDSVNLALLKENRPFTSVMDTVIAGATRFSAQAAGAGRLHHVVLRSSASEGDSISVRIERMQVACFEPW